MMDDADTERSARLESARREQKEQATYAAALRAWLDARRGAQIESAEIEWAIQREIDRVERYINGHRMTGWQPIESAPKDGTYILVWPPVWPDMPASIAFWDEDRHSMRPIPYWRRMDVGVYDHREFPPTHWMVVEPPEGEA